MAETGERVGKGGVYNGAETGESPRSSLAKRVGSPRGNTMDPIKKLRRGGALSPRPLRLPPFHSPVFFNLARQNQSVPDLLASFFLP
jgi:hypothetical protein